MGEQLILFRTRNDASFANFFTAGGNASLMHALRDWLQHGRGAFYVYGAPSSGRSHLLHAVCRDYAAQYLPLAELRDQDASQVLEALESVPVVCLDDIDAVIADPLWCEHLFHLFNRCAQTGTKLLISAACASAQLVCVLPDLQSRLRASGDFRLHALSDEELAAALRLRARERGIELSDDVIAYILVRQSRAFSSLLELLDQLDQQSMIEKKRITVPFVRRMFEAADSAHLHNECK